MNKEKILSIIIPVYNASKFIKRTLIKNLRNLMECEVIVIDDGSKDNTYKILNELQKKYSNLKIYHKENGGVSSARNMGIKYATCKYVFFLDCDDLVVGKTFKTLINILKNNDYDIVKGDFLIQRKIKVLFSKDSFIENKEEGIIEKKYIYDKFLTSTKLNSVWSQIYKKDLICNVTFNEKLIMAEDLDFNLVVYSKAKEIYYLPKPLLKYMYNVSSATRKSDLKKQKKQLEDIIYVYDKLYDYNIEWNMNIKKDEISNHIKNICMYLINSENGYSKELMEIYNNYKKERY